MLPVPRALLERLLISRAVVAPVERGALHTELTAWAHAQGWTVTTELPEPGSHRWLWLPTSRRALEQLCAAGPDVLILDGADTLLGPEDWAAALPALSPDQQRTTHRAAGGWPGALPVARALGRAGPDAARHPVTAVLLGDLLPPAPLRSAATRLAVSTLITPAVADALDVPPESLDALSDGGWLWPAPSGWAYPALLRAVLCPLPEPAAARRAAHALHGAAHDDAALDTLAGAEVWDTYVDLLARSARAGHGEAALRARWEPLPARWRDEPAARYLAGLLARAAGDLREADRLYSLALPELSGPVHAQASNARGVVRAMRGDVDGALTDFEAAGAARGLAAGEASQNRATLLIQLGRHAEAQSSLNAAVSAFRSAGDRHREAHSLETLGTLHFGRGLLHEALPAYRKALDLFLPDQASQAALVHLNLAESLAPLGELAQAHAHLQEAAALPGTLDDPRTAGWWRRARASLALHAADPAQALTELGQVDTGDRSLRAETALLTARAWRELGQPDAARAALAGAASLGLRADLEAALLGDSPLDPVIEEARAEEARLELVTGLLGRGRPDDLGEAFDVIRAHGYLALLDTRAASPLAGLAQDAESRALFPLRVQTLGPLRFTHAGRTVQLADFPTRKSAALLVALALAEHPQSREVLAERFWPGAKNPLASLQTAVYHLRGVFGVSLVASERGLLSLQFPVHSDVSALRRALGERDLDSLSALLRPVTAPLSVLPDLPAELGEERQQAERLLHDALRLHAEAQPAGDLRRRDALRALITADPLDLEARDDLIRWHEARGEHNHAEQERRQREEARRSLHG
ncbi:DNA-binding SARP family transcriptional activator [Deinococcus metalli]|nr:tetratricopeptide repeat protein [Deinococcus metalli]MBB5374881.1 DNA-binding SARP family transcriptional activator [Deinococcus metalli]